MPARLWPNQSVTLNTESTSLVNSHNSLLHRTKLIRVKSAGTMYTNAEQYGTVGCPVPDALTNGSAPAAVQRECTLGNMAAYVVKATSSKDVSKAVKFAAKYNLRLRIKNVRDLVFQNSHEEC
jgi:hypothetical protein